MIDINRSGIDFFFQYLLTASGAAFILFPYEILAEYAFLSIGIVYVLTFWRAGVRARPWNTPSNGDFSTTEKMVRLKRRWHIAVSARIVSFLIPTAPMWVDKALQIGIPSIDARIRLLLAATFIVSSIYYLILERRRISLARPRGFDVS